MVAVGAGAIAQAGEKYVAGGFEASGHVVTGAGYQHQLANAHPAVAGATTAEAGGTTSGVLGNYLTLTPQFGKQDDFLFFVDEFELNFSKGFGDNIRARADISFGRAASGSTFAGSNVEQAYATANIPVGNGLEFLLGRFDFPGGYQHRDVISNDTISQTLIIRSGARPSGLTGAKLYYQFTDAFDFNLFVVNTNGPDVLKAPVDVPSGGFRFGYSWGDGATPSTFGFYTLAGNDQVGTTTGKLKNFSFGGGVDFNWWATEAFAFGGEALFQRHNASAAIGAANSNTEVLAGQVNLKYVVNDVWDGTLQAAYFKQFDVAPNGTGIWMQGFQGSTYEIALAGNYAVADGATLKLQGQFDWIKNAANVKSYNYGAAWAFAYAF